MRPRGLTRPAVLRPPPPMVAVAARPRRVRPAPSGLRPTPMTGKFSPTPSSPSDRQGRTSSPVHIDPKSAPVKTSVPQALPWGPLVQRFLLLVCPTPHGYRCQNKEESGPNTVEAGIKWTPLRLRVPMGPSVPSQPRPRLLIWSLVENIGRKRGEVTKIFIAGTWMIYRPGRH